MAIDTLAYNSSIFQSRVYLQIYLLIIFKYERTRKWRNELIPNFRILIDLLKLLLSRFYLSPFPSLPPLNSKYFPDRIFSLNE